MFYQLFAETSVLEFAVYSKLTTKQFSLFQMILYFGNVVASFIVAFFISIMLEAPVVCLLKIAMAPKPARRQNWLYLMNIVRDKKSELYIFCSIYF